jgi:exopolysaccharide production protein ExoQ
MGVIAERPILGHGYSGFWNEDSREVQYLWLKAGWRAPDSHNGYLDVLVELGPVGLILYLAAWSRVLRWAVAAWRAGAVRESRWIVLFMLTNIVLNLDEGPMPYPNEFSMLMPAALATLSLWHNSVRVHAAQHRARPMRAALRLTQSARP